ncbi:hypothetical protein [Hymenobacter koreensis]|uniref:hypothetical protein n=1 Tax=Hymenobacter koreensis TaxID=1084523 RepID=UPI0031EEE730
MRNQTHRCLGLLILVCGLAGCRSQQAAFAFRPIYPPASFPDSAATTAWMASAAAPYPAQMPGSPRRPVGSMAVAATTARPDTSRTRRRPATPQRLPVTDPTSAPAVRAAPRPSQTTSKPVFSVRDAYKLFVALALTLGVGGILFITLLGGWLGISLGVLLILGALFLGLIGGFLGEFGSDEPFIFRQFFFPKRTPRP